MKILSQVITATLTPAVPFCKGGQLCETATSAAKSPDGAKICRQQDLASHFITKMLRSQYPVLRGFPEMGYPQIIHFHL
jgi:hypothetical protein